MNAILLFIVLTGCIRSPHPQLWASCFADILLLAFMLSCQEFIILGLCRPVMYGSLDRSGTWWTDCIPPSGMFLSWNLTISSERDSHMRSRSVVYQKALNSLFPFSIKIHKYNCLHFLLIENSSFWLSGPQHWCILMINQLIFFIDHRNVDYHWYELWFSNTVGPLRSITEFYIRYSKCVNKSSCSPS